MEWLTPELARSLDEYLRRYARPEEYDNLLAGALRLLAEDPAYYSAMGWARLVDKVQA